MVFDGKTMTPLIQRPRSRNGTEELDVLVIAYSCCFFLFRHAELSFLCLLNDSVAAAVAAASFSSMTKSLSIKEASSSFSCSASSSASSFAASVFDLRASKLVVSLMLECCCRRKKYHFFFFSYSDSRHKRRRQRVIPLSDANQPTSVLAAYVLSRSQPALLCTSFEALTCNPSPGVNIAPSGPRARCSLLCLLLSHLGLMGLGVS